MDNSFYKRYTCRLCESRNLKNVLPLTPSVLSDAYVTSERLNAVQEVFPLDLFLCQDCGFVQLPYVVDPKIIFRDYVFVSIRTMAGQLKHFQNYASEVMKRVNPIKESLVIDIGSNDGTLLKFFKKKGMCVLGIEPTNNIAREEAKSSNIKTLSDFFTAELVEKIKKIHGKALIVTFNKFANIDNLREITENVCKILAPEGILIIETSYLGDLIKNMIFDFIYHEHLSYFTIRPLVTFMNRFDLELIDIDHVPFKDGSLRYYFQRKSNTRSISPSVIKMIKQEEALELDKVETFKNFAKKINERKSKLLGFLQSVKSQGKTIAGFGGSATSTTLIYHFGLGEMMEYIVDDNPLKHNTFSPGFHIPVLPSSLIYERKPDYVLLLAWRFAEYILKKHHVFLKKGGHFILPLPEFKVIEN